MSEDIDKLLNDFSGSQRDNLIPILERIQDEQGYVSEEAIIKVSRFLKLPASKIYGVATFYDHFHFEPRARFTFRLCNGTACHVLGSSTLLKLLETELKIKVGKTSRDGTFALELVPCLGACSAATVIMVNDTYYARVTADGLKKIVETCKKKK